MYKPFCEFLMQGGDFVDKKTVKAVSLITQISISMIVPIVMCLFVGLFLDKLLGTSPLFLLIFIFLGIGGGFRSVYMLTKSFYDDEDTYIDINKYKGKGDKKLGKRD
jgi:F0F1-type ATP synthase assembly protein I